MLALLTADGPWEKRGENVWVEAVEGVIIGE